jgi:hypothetical protein
LPWRKTGAVFNIGFSHLSSQAIICEIIRQFGKTLQSEGKMAGKPEAYFKKSLF